ncbi:6-phosphogluconate dehydrogenase, decarboxylating 3 [Porphyridium purpureum]|uniref:6-phosphogluconate dehydrogenase, decarboxylating n=1 Tax=Porphyridium purpureum TaxID=35688 RepID=A0A5J4YWD6_PORPP|nr:6-phosphogluconate dehydrogenase, decarboxylating 3 [Porphyridium purpureum]|eukprot:POR4213..scf227_4
MSKHKGFVPVGLREKKERFDCIGMAFVGSIGVASGASARVGAAVGARTNGCGTACAITPALGLTRCRTVRGSAHSRSVAKKAWVVSAAVEPTAQVGLVGLAVMGQNLALNIAEKGFDIAVYNRSYEKTKDTVARAERESLSDKLKGYESVDDFIAALQKPRKIIMLVKAGAPVDATIATLKDKLEPGDMIIDGGNEWYTNTERRGKEMEEKQIAYIGMGVSGGEEGARYGPSMMPGGPKEAYSFIEPIVTKVAAQVNDGPCVTYIGPGGAGNYVKMVHNGIEYGDMQLIGEAYDVLSTIGGLSADQLASTFADWNKGMLDSFLVEITAKIMAQKDTLLNDGSALVSKILDKSGSKGTGMWTMEEAVRRAVPAPTIMAALEARYLSALKDERIEAAKVLKGPEPANAKEKLTVSQEQLVSDVQAALYASKICSYAQGMNLIRTAANENGWELDLGEIARIWKGGCIIRAKFLDRIKAAYVKDSKLPSLLVDPDFAKELESAQAAWRNVVSLAVQSGIAVPAMSGSISYYDTYRRATLPSSQMVQAQRDFFGSHTYQRTDTNGVYHTRWSSDGVTETM